MTRLSPLVRHFLGSLLGRGVLEDEGIESVRTLFFSIVAMLLSVGLFLPRRFSAVYGTLAMTSTAEVYQAALVADGLFMFSLVFLVSVFVAAIIAPSMFPDETDYIALIPLPLSRRRFFAAKFLSLVLFAAVLLSSLVLLTSLAFPAFTHGAWAGASLPARIGAHALGAAVAGIMGFAFVVAVQGAILTTMSHRWLTRASVAFQCACVGFVVLAAPFALQLVALRQWVATEPAALRWVPTAWAMGIQQAALGLATPYWTRLAWMGVAALGGVVLVSLAAHAVMYRHCERLILPPPPERLADGAPARRRTATEVRGFVLATLTRNRLPLLLFLAFIAAAFSFMAIDVIEWWRTRGLFLTSRGQVFERATTSVRLPLVVMLLGVAGLRMAFLVPVLSRANWIFRTTDDGPSRKCHLGVVDRTMFAWVVVPALILGLPFQLIAGDAVSAAARMGLTALAGAVMVEVALGGWRRIPFTCSWIPAQRPLVLILAASGAALMLVSVLLPPAIVAASGSPLGFGLLAAILGGVAGSMRWRRLRTWADQPLVFEDEVYDKGQTLGLTK